MCVGSVAFFCFLEHLAFLISCWLLMEDLLSTTTVLSELSGSTTPARQPQKPHAWISKTQYLGTEHLRKEKKKVLSAGCYSKALVIIFWGG